ncbi:MAG: hypothetical protein A2Z12_04735 [Actinobacteria bacterium RBG_16_68_21]|nr:MAG: hypothetical protein A2Z12_04735 [Actinobacteria bacterium RBG_16_68_21]
MQYVYGLDAPPNASPGCVQQVLGNKGANLAVMTRELGLPVPPGFTITTEACLAYLEHGWPPGLDDEIRSHLQRIEQVLGRRFGGPGHPLLVSVRSGAPISMPGMMETILNLGLNDATERGLAETAADATFAAACRARFDKRYRQVVGVSTVPSDPWEQLRAAIEAMFRSWNSERASAYRAHEAIPDDLGTGVTVQAMVFGNLGDDSATGVVFTRNPVTGEAELYGDVMFGAQGEDIVAGTHTPDPISALDTRMPEIASELRRYADILERRFTDVCDIEFTVERGKLWMLQVRKGKLTPPAALRVAIEMAEHPDFPLSRVGAVERVARHLVDSPERIDGATTPVFVDAPGVPKLPVADVMKLLDWAKELKLPIGDTADESPATQKPANTPEPDAVIRALFIKGFATPALLAPAVLTTEELLTPVVEALRTDGLVSTAGPMFQLTDGGKARGTELMDADRAAWSIPAATKALDAFVALDHRMKEIVTAWQMRIVDGEQALNDHTDAVYDGRVLADFSRLHADAANWLRPLGDELPRLGDYAARLAGAAAQVAGGDHAYIASPRLDSYHSVWFELHEDLIHLAGRTREDEVAAGRA